MSQTLDVRFDIRTTFAGVSREDNGTLQGATIMELGTVNDSRPWFADATTLEQVAKMIPGRKSRFGHPQPGSNSEGSFLGVWSNIEAGLEKVKGDLPFAKAARNSPGRGDLATYVVELAEEAPDTFGVSVAGTLDVDAMIDGKTENDKFPIRFKSIGAADIVDDPAATSGLFSKADGEQLTTLLSTASEPAPDPSAEEETPVPDTADPITDPGQLDTVEQTIDAITLRAWQQKFGAEHGVEYALQGLTFEQALQKELTHSTDRVTALEKERDELAAELATLKASVGTDYVPAPRHEQLLNRFAALRQASADAVAVEFQEALPEGGVRGPTDYVKLSN